MEPFIIHPLGVGSALPTLRHYNASQIVEVRGKFFMVDCGEGTQIQLRRTHIHFNKLRAVFISHLHGDHCFGVIGMISTFGLLGRTAPLHVYAPVGFSEMLKKQMEFFCHGFDYEVVCHDIEDTTKPQVIYDDKSLTVTTIPLDHRVPCCGFLFREKPTLPHIRRDMIDFYNIPLCYINNIKNGQDWTLEDGTVVPNERLVKSAEPVRSYAYCSDTRYIPTLHEQLKGVTVLYHEATYCDDMAANAAKYFHSTAREAATVARDAGVGQLWLGHYSARYNDERLLLDEARKTFPESYLTQEMQDIEVK